MAGSSPLGEPGEDEYFGRSDRAFFHQAGTKQAITSLARANSLVIYCGSGVTIDRTGATWGKLIYDLMSGYARDDSQALGDIAVLSDKLSPPQLASILYQVRLREVGDHTSVMRSLAARLHTILYEGKGWEAGVLVRNIVRLAVTFLRLKKRVVLVTTNYDDYLENEYRVYKEETASVVPGDAAFSGYPGLRVTVVGHQGDIVNEPSTHRSIPQLRIVYLHGRISRDLAYSGNLVLSEQDYHSSRPAVMRELCRYFREKGAGLLIVGSSLRDTPLLSALAETASSDNSRYALLPAESTGMTDVPPSQFARLQDYLAKRGDHFGIKILMPDFHYQPAQFCLELLLACDDAEYASDRRNIRYGRRLLAWWSAWNRQDPDSAGEAAHSSLFNALKELESTFTTHRGDRVPDQEENFKLELWVRFNPERFRGLCLWASSAGTLHDRRLLRRERLVLFSANASVRAFAEGRPRYLSRQELTAHDSRSPNSSDNSRWKSFLSVPIRLDVSRSREPVELPVGVVTLASTAPKGAQSMIPAEESERMERLVKKLEDLGRDLLRV